MEISYFKESRLESSSVRLVMSRDMDKHTPKKIKASARELRKAKTPAEEMLWQQLRGRKLNELKFRRQHPQGRVNQVKLA
jgi:very-short-patch-repair endonuclease